MRVTEHDMLYVDFLAELRRDVDRGWNIEPDEAAALRDADELCLRGLPVSGTVHFLDLTCPDGSGEAACGAPFSDVGRVECRPGAFLLLLDRCRACEAVLLPVVAA